MKTSEDQWNRWIDGSLTKEELEALESGASAAEKADAERARRIAEDLRRSIPSSIEPPYASFFNARIQRQIRETAAADTPASSRGRWWQALLQPAWLVPAAAALLVGVFVGRSLGPAGSTVLAHPSGDQVHSYSPESGVEVESERVDRATVVRLTGLASLPEDANVVWNELDPTSGLIVPVVAPDGRRHTTVIAAHALFRAAGPALY